MLFDLNRWLAPEQEPAASGRVFAHEMFISHRRFDLPIKLVEALSANGASIAWDHDLDLCDRRVMQGVARAMRRSRFVALYVSNNFVDSPWCRAEYLNALWIEEHYKIPRVLAICESGAALPLVPVSLRQVRQFDLTQIDERELAAIVVSENSVGNQSAEELRGRVPNERLCQDTRALSPSEQLNLLKQRTLFWLEHGMAEIQISENERAALSLTTLISDPITEVETIFREVCSLVFNSRTVDRCGAEIGPTELTIVIDMAKAIAKGYSYPAREEEMKGLDKWAYDFVLKPLLLAVELAATQREAASAYRDLCLALLRGKFAYEVPVYLSVLAAVEEGQNVATAISGHRVALYDAQQRQRRLDMTTD